jgi:Spy/CpxP family protein refolding chaperone|tara:strand:- start:1007 stop:1378 length:372 start_codon:yes stop_codon:yes gene_type:complete
MKKVIMICALVVATVVHVQAQRQGDREINPEKMAERMTQRMDEKLDLTEEQEKQINALFLEQANSRKESQKANREEMKAAREAHQKKLEAILTPEQKEKWEAEQKEGRSQMRKKRGGRQGGGE